MSRQSTRMRGWLRVATLALALPIAGCFAFGHNNTDIDRTPEVNTGTSATIIYPGQGAPVLPPSLYGASPRPGSGSVRSSGTTPATAPSPGAPPTGTAPTYGAPTRGSPAPAYGGAPAAATPPEQAPAYGTPHQAGQPAGGMAMLGGAHMNEVEHTQYDEEPSYFKYLMLPFAILASPFTLAYEALVPDPEDGPELPRPRPTAPTVQNTQPVAPPDYETAMIQNLERELDQRQASAPPPSPAPQAPRSSIADELAELQRAPAPSAPPRSAPAVQTRRSTPPSEPADRGAQGIVDRDGDGRIDQWIYRENGRVLREELDEDFDGRPDRILHYDRETHEVASVDEDSDFDGRVDTWTEYAGGQVQRRREDSDGDGSLDTWSLYREGQLQRLERDLDGDGFRDRVSFYEDGRLAREARDTNGDGELDVISHYDASERLSRRETDTNADGRPDVISYYEDGRLARRELLTAPSAEPESGRP